MKLSFFTLLISIYLNNDYTFKAIIERQIYLSFQISEFTRNRKVE